MTTYESQTPVGPAPRRPESPLTPADAWMGLSYENVGAADQQTFLRPTERCLLGPTTVSPGVFPVISDSALGWLALHATGDDRFIVTSNMHVDVLGRARPDSVLTVRRGRVLAVDGLGVICAGNIYDLTSEVVVAATTARFAVVPLGSRNAGSVAEHAPSADETFERDAAVLGPPIGDDPVSRMFDLSLSSRDGNSLTFVAGSRLDLANDRGGLHGGVAGLLGQHVPLVALGVVRPDVTYRCVETRAVYLRPVPSIGAGIRCQVRVLHHGRRQAVVQTSLLDSLGNVAVEVGAVFAHAGAR